MAIEQSHYVLNGIYFKMERKEEALMPFGSSIFFFFLRTSRTSVIYLYRAVCRQVVSAKQKYITTMKGWDPQHICPAGATSTVGKKERQAEAVYLRNGIL